VFEQTFKNIDDILHKDAGCTSEPDYTEQSSWLLFLNYLVALGRTEERRRADRPQRRDDRRRPPTGFVYTNRRESGLSHCLSGA